MAAFIVLTLVIRFETGFDTFHSNYDKIYRVVTVIHFPDGTKYSGDVPSAVPQGLRTDYPDLRDVTALVGEYNALLETLPRSHDGHRFKEKQGVFWAEPNFLHLFNFPLLAGDANTALAEPNTALLTESTARNYFGNWKAAIGQSIKAWTGDLFTVTGILRDPPANTDLPIKVLLSYKTLQGTGFMQEWAAMRGGSYCFLRLPDGLSPQQFDAELQRFSRRHKPTQWQIEGHVLQPLRDMHFAPLYSTYTGMIFPRPLITALWSIGIFLLLIACINFVNASTARALNRSREIGIRKILGSSRKQLVLQLLGETGLITAASLFIAILLTMIAIPAIGRLIETPLSLKLMLSPLFLPGLPVFWFIITLLSGFYPALVLSGLHPITALKEQTGTGRGGAIFLRKALVVFQFSFAQLLIICVVVITTQINFFRLAPLGFEKDNVLTIPIPEDSLGNTRIAALRQQLSALPAVGNISFSLAPPAELGWQKMPFQFNGAAANSDFDASLKWADTAYFQLYGLRFIAGRPYAQSDTTTGWVVNETLLQKEHIADPKRAIGMNIRVGGGPALPIVGVVRDFSTTSLRNPIDPVILATNKQAYRLISIRIRTDEPNPLIARVAHLWQQNWPSGVFEYDFLDQHIAGFYRLEEKFAQLFRIFTAVAVAISCLGLYALAAFMTARRRKEVAVRKVLGASVLRVAGLFLREFTFPVLLAFAIAAPIATLLMRRWLDSYAFRIQLGPAIFGWCILASIAIAWITVGGKVIASASGNPVRCLRD